MRDWELSNPFLTAWLRLRQAYRAAIRIAEIEMSQFQSTIAQLDILNMLNATEGSLTPGEISSYLFLDNTGISALLTRMQRVGLVKKVRSRVDQRVVRIQMLPKGKELLAKARRLHGGTCQTMEECFSENEVKQLDDYLKRYRDHCLQKLGKKAQPLPSNLDIEKLSVWL
jgi:DNA-binding MarR family transcriptional regulator